MARSRQNGLNDNVFKDKQLNSQMAETKLVLVVNRLDTIATSLMPMLV
jgi:hypothetical protein